MFLYFFYGGFSEHTSFELITSYWYDMYKSRNNPRWRYFLWKVEFRWQVIEALEKSGHVIYQILHFLLKDLMNYVLI